MKCIHFYNPINSVQRVTDAVAAEMVKAGVARYISRSLWRKMK